ncbi:MAG: alpha/beta fold hydrolase [Pirellulales bacterium]
MSDRRPADYPYASHYLSVAGGRLHYLDERPLDASSAAVQDSAADSSLPVLLCVHGNPTWSYYWRHVVEAFRGRARVVVVDHLGCGYSDKPQDYPYRLADHVGNLQQLVESLDLRDVTLLAHDWGGAIGMGAAGRMPERFRALCAVQYGRVSQHALPVANSRLPHSGPGRFRRSRAQSFRPRRINDGHGKAGAFYAGRS